MGLFDQAKWHKSLIINQIHSTARQNGNELRHYLPVTIYFKSPLSAPQGYTAEFMPPFQHLHPQEHSSAQKYSANCRVVILHSSWKGLCALNLWAGSKSHYRVSAREWIGVVRLYSSCRGWREADKYELTGA